jgi:hypothetical protein
LEGYSILTQATKRMEANDIAIDNASYISNNFYRIFKKYLTGATDCSLNGKKCDANMLISNYNNKYGIWAKFDVYMDDGVLILQNGMMLFFNNNGSQPILITIDINGYKNGPNRFGYDTFIFSYNDGKIIPYGTPETEYSNNSIYCNSTSKTNYRNGLGCAYNAIHDPNYFINLFKEKNNN